MFSRYFLPAVALTFSPSCSKDEAETDPQGLRLYLWLYGADDHVPTDVNPGKGGGSAVRLGEALTACGSKKVAIEDYGLGGDAVSVSSSRTDAALLKCVKARVDFGFNASRTIPSEWRTGKRGDPIAPISGS